MFYISKHLHHFFKKRAICRPQAHWRKSREAEDIGGSRRVEGRRRGGTFQQHLPSVKPAILEACSRGNWPSPALHWWQPGFRYLGWMFIPCFPNMILRILSLGSWNLHPCYIGWLLLFSTGSRKISGQHQLVPKTSRNFRRSFASRFLKLYALDLPHPGEQSPPGWHETLLSGNSSLDLYLPWLNPGGVDLN